MIVPGALAMDRDMQTLIDQCAIHFDVVGDGPPVLFAHGFPLSGRMWAATVEALRDRWRCVVPDLRGHGRSGTSPAASMTRYADDLAGVLDVVGEKQPAVFVGLSMGGMIGFEFFRRHRRRLRALVLADTRATPDTPEGLERRERMAQAALTHGSRAVADMMIEQLMAPEAAKALRDEWHAVMSRTPPAGLAAAARALAGRPDSVPTLARIDCPTLLVFGEQDALTPPSLGEEMQKRIAGARLAVIPGAGHLPPVEQPDTFNAALRGFLEQIA